MAQDKDGVEVTLQTGEKVRGDVLVGCDGSIAIISGSSKFTDVANYPLTTTGLVSYDTEGKIYAKYLTRVLPNAKFAILYQNDDIGKDYVNAFKAFLGKDFDRKVRDLIAAAGKDEDGAAIRAELGRLANLNEDNRTVADVQAGARIQPAGPLLQAKST